LFWCFAWPHFFGEAFERRPWINKRDAPGRFCPASLLTVRLPPLLRQPLRGSYHPDAATPCCETSVAFTLLEPMSIRKHVMVVPHDEIPSYPSVRYSIFLMQVSCNT
jgi:hypothetical protein